MAEDTQTVAPPQYTPSADETGALESLKTGPMKSVADPFERLYKSSQQASFENETAKRKQAKTLAQGKSDAAQTMYAGMLEQKTAMDKMAPPPKMNITPDTHEGLMGLATILPIAGILLGSKGMMSGVNAMNAMTGVMKGYQEGNKARIEFEKQKYDTSMKEWDANYKISRQKLADAIEMMKTNYQAGVAEAETAAVAMGPEPAAIVRQNGAAFLLNKLDEANKHVLDAETKIQELRMRQAQTSKTQQGQNQRLILGTAGAASAFEKIAGIRAGTTSGILPFLSNKEGMFNYLQSFAGRTLSSDDAKILDVYYTGVARNLAAIEAAGAASGLVGLTETFKKIQPMEKDSNYVVAAKMADARRIVEESMNAVSASGVLTPEQNQEVQRLLSRFAKAVPYTLEEVNEAVRKKGKKQETIGEATRRAIQGPEASREQKNVVPLAVESENKRKAREAITQGAPRDVVIKRLQEAGEDISGL
jgi:hypothetical protein